MPEAEDHVTEAADPATPDNVATEAPTDEPPGDEPPADEPPADEPPADEAPHEEDPAEEAAPEAAAPDADASGSRKKSAKKPDWPPPPPERLEGAIEALVLVSGDVIKLGRLRDLLGLASVIPLREALTGIRERWAQAGLAMELEEVAGGVRAVTRPEFAEYVGRLARRPASDKLTKTLLETLCIVAYKQPVGRAEVENIRGVQSGDPLRGLLDRRLVKVVGRSEQPGRPLLYGTTQSFLTAFGLKDLKDLPSPKDLKRL